MTSFWVFDQPAATKLTLARQASLTGLLGPLKRQLDLHTALDLGCGVGYFSTFLSGMGFDVVGVDGRTENVQEAARRFPDLSFRPLDVEDPKLVEVGSFDLVLCLGLLYHLENPFRAVRNLAAVTDKVTVIEAVCVPYLRPILELGDEAIAENQGLNYVAFYPSESCLVKMLYRSGFAYVYRPQRLPEHENYRESFSKRRLRTMMLASKVPLALGSLILLPEPVNLFPQGAGLGSPWAKPWAVARESTTRLARESTARLVRFALKPWREKVRSAKRHWAQAFSKTTNTVGGGT